MKILKSNNGNDTTYIAKNDIFVKITDFRMMYFLKEIIIGPGQHTWEWIPLKENLPIDLTGIDDKYSTFDNVINRSVNNLYCTIYCFSSYAEFFNSLREIKYVDTIKTIYITERNRKA